MGIERRAKFDGFFQGEIRHDEAAYSCVGSFLREPFQPVLQKGVGIAHQNQPGMEASLAGAQSFHHPGERHPVGQRLAAGGFDDGAVRYRVGKGNAQFDDVRPGRVDFLQFVPEGVGGGKSGGDEGDDGRAAFGMCVFDRGFHGREGWEGRGRGR